MSEHTAALAANQGCTPFYDPSAAPRAISPLQPNQIDPVHAGFHRQARCSRQRREATRLIRRSEASAATGTSCTFIISQRMRPLAARFDQPPALALIERFLVRGRLLCSGRQTQADCGVSPCSSAIMSSSLSWISAAPAIPFTCWGLRTPTIAPVTAGFRRVHAMATSPGVAL